MQSFRSNGKLLLSGEYLVLYGAQALAIPTSRGQEMRVFYTGDDRAETFYWTLEDPSGMVFTALFDYSMNVVESSDEEMAGKLRKLFGEIESECGAGHFRKTGVRRFESVLEFPMDWGLGSSSTLVNNLAMWSGADAFKLQRAVFDGSAYDVACAMNISPIHYRLAEGRPVWEEVNFSPPFSDHIFFIHLNQKQDSREGIAMVKNMEGRINEGILREIDSITHRMTQSSELPNFESCMEEHEAFIARLLEMKALKESKFAGFDGAVKSLGAWGGDFIMATGSTDDMKYFRDKGYSTIIPFEDMILRSS